MKRCDPHGASPSPNLQGEKLVTAVVLIKASGGGWQAALKELAMPLVCCHRDLFTIEAAETPLILLNPL